MQLVCVKFLQKVSTFWNSSTRFFMAQMQHIHTTECNMHLNLFIFGIFPWQSVATN